MRPESEARRVQIALVLGYLGGIFTMVFYVGIAVWVFSQGKASQSEGFMFGWGTAVILALFMGPGAFVLARGFRCEDASLEKRRAMAFQLGLMTIVVTVWIPLGAFIGWLLLPYS